MEEETASEDVSQQYVTFTNGDRHFGVEITRVREIRQFSETTELPNQPHYTRGVINIRGEVIPVHDLRMRFGGARTDASPDHVILIVSIQDQNAGILVDAVSDIAAVAYSEIRPVPTGAQEGEADKAISGLVAKDDLMVALIDLDRLFPTAVDTAA